MLPSLPRLCLEGALHSTLPHNRRAFVTLWPFQPCGNKYVWFVPPLVFRVRFPFKWREIIVGIGFFSWACSCIACKTQPAWPTTGLFKHSGLGLEDVDLWRGSARPAPDGWDQHCKMEKFCASQSSDVYAEKQHTSEWIICPAFSHSYSKSFCMEELYEAEQPWRMSLNHGTWLQRSLLTDVYCTGA